MVAKFRLSDGTWAAIEPRTPRDQPRARRVDDRRAISGIVHAEGGLPLKDCLRAYGPPTTIYDSFNRWSRRRHRGAFGSNITAAHKRVVDLVNFKGAVLGREINLTQETSETPLRRLFAPPTS